MTFGKIAKIAGYPITATLCLNELFTLGYVERNVKQDKTRTVEYSLTKKGKELAEVALKILDLEKQ